VNALPVTNDNKFGAGFKTNLFCQFLQAAVGDRLNNLLFYQGDLGDGA
jgi:hypothetical protein